MEPFVFNEVSFRRGEFSLHADLTLPPGKLTVVLGPSGCGKTTLLDLAAGFLRPDRGRIFEGHRDVTDLKPDHRKVGMVFQDHALFPHMSVGDNVAFGPRMRGKSRNEARNIAEEKLTVVGLSDLTNRRPFSLSGGEKQRVSLARALAIEPDILLLDEPYSSLDAALRVDLRRQVKNILTTAGVTAVLVTHDQEEALAMADYLAVMNRGRIVAFGTPLEIWQDPSDTFTASFIGRTTRLEVLRLVPDDDGSLLAHTRAGTARLAETTSERAHPANLMIRPEDLTLTEGSGLCGRIVTREYRGRDWMLQLVPDGAPPTDRIEADWNDGEPPPVGTNLTFHASGDRIRLISSPWMI